MNKKLPVKVILLIVLFAAVALAQTPQPSATPLTEDDGTVFCAASTAARFCATVT